MHFERPLAGWLLLTLSPCLLASPAGGISLGQTRLIFPATEHAQSLSIKNTGSARYLVQSRVQKGIDDPSAAPFMVTPPLLLLPGKSQQLLRVLYQGAELPEDREAVFYLAITAVPAQTAETFNDRKNTKLSLGIRFMTKLFYRPAGLTPSHADAICRLQFQHTKQTLHAHNPTPYYITLGTLNFAGKALDLAAREPMLAPYASADFPTSTSTGQVQWQAITDHGGLSSPCIANVQWKQP
ncbi:molecular chaperone [Pseudomonas sp. 8O]|uniref:fimbrial biogenesis chaperone n=1 Tax=Pseudomonas sp. 8O TaxID=2653165 RepID=UPI0012F1475E|nr:molecular chaperone [Pseudomonas sp. 8O]VXC35946.1 conserved hypothetical protein [Pseudomonas sp. 8O]